MSEHTPSAESTASMSNIKHVFQRLFNNVVMVGLLEFRSASVSLTAIIASAIGIALLGITLWELITFALGVYLYYQGVSLMIIIGALALMQIVLIVPLTTTIAILSKKLLFPATRQALDTLKDG